MKPTLVTCYVNPDLDGVAGAIAYAEFLNGTGVPAVAGMIGDVQSESKYVLDRFNLEYPMALANAYEYEKIILVDASELIGLEGKVRPESVVEIIDHRQHNDADKFPNAKIQVELVGAAATLVAERFMSTSTPMSMRSALLVESAIISNTLNFKSGTTTDRDRNAKAWLNKITNLPDGYWRELFVAKSEMTGAKLGERIDADFAWFELGGRKVGCAQLEMIGVMDLIATRGDEVVAKLAQIKKDLNLDLIFGTFIELEQDSNTFIADDPEMQAILTKILNIQFVGNFAHRDGLIMRKQISPLLKAELQK